MAQEHTMELDALCNDVLNVNENVLSVSVINKHGRAIEEMTHEGSKMPIEKQKNEMLLMQTVLTISMGRDFDEQLGEIGYIHVDRKNLSMFSFPLGDNIILVTSKTATGPISLAKKIVAAIKKYPSASKVLVSCQSRVLTS